MLFSGTCATAGFPRKTGVELVTRAACILVSPGVVHDVGVGLAFDLNVLDPASAGLQKKH
jgi:hypothetical protein